MRWPYPRTPALGRGLPSNFVDGQRIFEARVKAEFPKGTAEARLLDDLLDQGFSVQPSQGTPIGSASVIKGLIFKRIWSVRWRAQAGRIEDIWAIYGVMAP